ncbi:hypothetical protein AZE42_06514 [Rhizopogon vesiculosus]|uniref:Uncharacterized protein n=1 Tax=Rhizopogon vesiculosus TaxID=180088 RepID=A0A1J8QJI9_9AGAM|nr:hypothetical protein AZE42_06514 [Rhizopogon vesiculosus]
MSAAVSNVSLSGSDAEDEGVHGDGLTNMPGIADAYNVHTGYLPSLRAHIRDTISHLTGSITSHDGTCLDPQTKSTPAPPELVEEGSTDLESELPIWCSSLSSWSQSEVDAFFHAVSVHSRWRPDLIADAVKTKGEVEVVEFLITLDSYADSYGTETDQDIRRSAPTPPAAIEVSDKWVAAEEAMAAAIAVEEEYGERQALEALRRKRASDASADMILRGKRRRVASGVGEDVLMGSESERADEEDDIHDVNAGKARFEKWHARKIAAWKREDLLAKLEDAHLQVLDAILREDGEVQKGKGVTHEQPDASDPDTGVDLKALSPMSRRRLTKRLYMRRKRAQLRGEDVGQVAEVVSLERMKPGRKPGKKGKERSVSVAEVTEGEKLPSGKKVSERRTTTTPELVESGFHPSDEDGPDDANETTAKKTVNISGKTRHQKTRAEFENAGIDATYLRKHSMDLFHYGPLGKLVGIFKPLADCPEDDISASYISADLVQYLQALVIAFTTDVMHRATMWKEQANELKGQKKVWRGALHQINQAAIEHALKTIGMRTVSKQEYFSKFLDHYDLARDKQYPRRKSGSPVAADAEGEQSTAAGHSPNIESNQHETELSSHRALYTPAFLTPAAFNIGIVDTFFPGYDACFPPKTNEDSREEPLLSDETDEEVLEDELQEDEMLDHADVEADKKFEEQLWAEVQRERGVASE